MLTSEEKQAIEQEVTALFEDYYFATQMNDGTKNDDTSLEEPTTKAAALEPRNNSNTSTRLDRYAHLTPELASHAIEFERHHFLCKNSAWNQVQAGSRSLKVARGMQPTVATPPQEPVADGGRSEQSYNEQIDPLKKNKILD
ncbi:hypothetical protein ACHAP8_002645 [Fusarium lateritium]